METTHLDCVFHVSVDISTVKGMLLTLASPHQTVPNSYTTMFNATYYEVSFLNTTPVGSILFGFTLYINPITVPLGSSVILTITGNIVLGTFASYYFSLLSAHSYTYIHAINSASDYVVTDQVYYYAQTTFKMFTFNLQSLVPPSQIVGANNVGVTIIGE